MKHKEINDIDGELSNTTKPARLNVFEGARRIAMVIAAIPTIYVLIGVATSTPYLPVYYHVTGPDAPFIKTDNSCPAESRKYYFSKEVSNGYSAHIELCLLSSSFGKDSRQLIPYKIDKDGMIWGAWPYSSEVDEYTRALERRFAFSDVDTQLIEKELSRIKRNIWLESLGYLVASLAIFWMFVCAIGWIVRGFAGIPRGADHRPRKD